MNNVKFLAAIVFGFLSTSHLAHAECARDASGLVHCSQQPTGGAAKDGSGNVQCGKGQCRKDGGGTVHCSKVVGGGAEVDAIEYVQCLGGCERGTREMCVRGDR